ncbi:MAG: paraquat-inducible protein A [Stenotrophobium sp.]
MPSAPLVICEHCDSVYQRQVLKPGEAARCQRCGSVLYRHGRHDLDSMLALTLASLIVFLIANAYPIMRLDLAGIENDTTLWHAILTSYDSGVGAIAIAAAVCVFIFPLMQIGLFLYVLLPLRMGRVPRAFIGAMHALRQMQPWSMVEVFMLGTLVSVVKLSVVAEVTPETGFWGFVALACLLTALINFDLRLLWDRAEALQS